MDFSLCPDSVPGFLGSFDFSIAPPLLFYAYIPAIAVALGFSLFIYTKDAHSHRAKLLVGIALTFAVWVVSLILQWILTDVRLVMFAWQITPLLELCIPVLSLYFVYVFVTGDDLPFTSKLVLASSIILAALLMPSTYTTTSFDYQNCQANYNSTYYLCVYLFELCLIVWTQYICYRTYSTLPASEHQHKMQIAMLAAGAGAFLTTFFVSNSLGEYMKAYEINLFGPIGILAFIGFMTVMIMRYGAFNIKTFTTQVLVVATSILIAAQLLSPSSVADEVVTLITLLLFFVSGYFLIRSVRTEIAAKEALAIANERQAEITSLITHQIRGVFTNTKAGLSTILEGTFGAVPPQMLTIVKAIYTSQVVGVNEVESFLQAQRVESGTVQYAFAPCDLRPLVEDAFNQQKPTAASKQLAFDLHIQPGDYTLVADKIYVLQVITNLIDNALRYTKRGSITVSLERRGQTVVYAVADTGAGIPESDKPRMFTKYGHGEHSRKLNAASTGLGLYIVKNIVDGHGGTITYETQEGVGTTFIVTLPVTQPLPTN